MAGMNRTEEIGMYLGVLMIEGCMTKAFFYPLLQKVDSHLAGWKSNMLSFFGRVIMAKSILSTLPNHLIQAMYLPKLVCEEFNKKIQDFIWGDQWANKRVHLVNWHQVTLPVDYVGLGIRTYRKMNMAFLVKLGQRLLKEEDAFWSKIVRGKYFARTASLDAFVLNLLASALWQGLVESADLPQRGYFILIVNGHLTSFWNDT